MSSLEPAPTVGPLSRDQVHKAVKALLKWLDKQKAEGRQQLVEDDELFNLIVTLNKTPAKPRTNPHRIPIPHSLYSLDGIKEVCLFVKDVDGKGHKEAKKRVQQEEGLGVTKVIGVSKLRANYGTFEAKRQLCGSYDLFLADDRVVKVLPKLLGKAFFSKKKHPIPVRLEGKNWVSPIRRACNSTYFYTGGSCSSVRVGRASQTAEEIVDNVMVAVAGVADYIPKGWKNVKSLYLKTTESTSLPIYNAALEVPLKIDGGAATGQAVT